MYTHLMAIVPHSHSNFSLECKVICMNRLTGFFVIYLKRSKDTFGTLFRFWIMEILTVNTIT